MKMEHGGVEDEGLMRYAAAQQKLLSYIAEHTGFKVFDITVALMSDEALERAVGSPTDSRLTPDEVARVREIAARCLEENPGLADYLSSEDAR